MQETQVWSLGLEDPLKEEMATHSSILVWKTPLTEGPLRLWSMGVTKNQTQLSMHAHFVQHFLESCLCYVNGGIAETYTKKKKKLWMESFVNNMEAAKQLF